MKKTDIVYPNIFTFTQGDQKVQMTTKVIIDQFCEKIDLDKTYSITDLKNILTEVYRSHFPAVKKTVKKNVNNDPVVMSSDSSDEEKPKKRGRPIKIKLDRNGNVKTKRTPTAYNKFMSEKIKELKQASPETDAKQLMKDASAVWKVLSEEDKEQYK